MTYTTGDAWRAERRYVASLERIRRRDEAKRITALAKAQATRDAQEKASQEGSRAMIDQKARGALYTGILSPTGVLNGCNMCLGTQIDGTHPPLRVER